MPRFPTASAALALAALLIVAGCGKPAGGASGQATTVTMTMDNFVNNDETYTMKAGQAITFVGPANTGGLHILCIGKDGRAKSRSQADRKGCRETASKSMLVSPSR